MKHRILVFNWQDITNPLGGGAEVHVHEILKHLVKMGHDVLLFCHYFKGSRRKEIIDGVRIVRWGSRINVNYLAPFIYRNLFKNEDFDIVVECINKLPYFTPLYVKKPVLCIVHHLFGATAFSEATFPSAIYVTIFEKLIPHIYRRNIFEVISNSTRDDLIVRGINEAKIRIVHCGIDHSKYFKAKEAVKSPYPLILVLGRLKKYKSVDHVIMAFPKVREKFPEARLVIVGEGDHFSTLKKVAFETGQQEFVKFTGFISHEEKLELYRSAHVAVNPSPKEGWGLTVIEANACGTVVLAADSPGLKDSVVSGKTGLLFPHGDINALAECLKKILGNRELRESMESEALRWAKTFTWENAADETLKLIDETLINARGNGAPTK